MFPWAGVNVYGDLCRPSSPKRLSPASCELPLWLYRLEEYATHGYSPFFERTFFEIVSNLLIFILKH